MKTLVVATHREAHTARQYAIMVLIAVAAGSFALCAGSILAPQAPVASADSVTGGVSVELNIPAFRLEVFQDGRVRHSYTVAVGMRRYQTPTGEFLISNLVWNPWWYPPDAARARNDTVTPPGPANPMGKAKLALSSLYFLHGTPAISSLGKAASHGCVRMHNDDVVQLASLVERYHGDRPTTDTVRRGSWDWSRTRAIRLAVPVPVRIVYALAEVRDSLLIVYPDVYRRAGGDRMPHIMTALTRAGIDSATVSRAAIDRALRAAGAKPAQIHLRELNTPSSMRVELRPGKSGG
jgi:hypothetical protein